MIDMPPPSWEVFEACETCGTLKGKPCWDLRIVSIKSSTPTTNPHRSRKKIKKINPYDNPKNEISDRFYPR